MRLVLTPGDYDGDGKTDLTIWRPGTQGTFHVLGSGIGYFSYGWGSPGDYPPANYPASAQTITPDALAAFTSPPEGDHLVESAPFTLTGWAIDLHAALSPGIDHVDVWAVHDLGAGPTVEPVLGVAPTSPGATYGDPALDPGPVTLQYGEQFRHAGFSLPIAPHALAPDAYLIIGYPHSSSSGSIDYQHPAVRALHIESEIQPLSVTLAGTGTGTVTSTPAGLSACTGGDGVQCNGFDYGAVVTLTATGTNNSAFLGWTGACTGFAPSQVTLTQARAVTAHFGPPPIVTTYYHLDPIGSVRALSNAAGQIIEQHDYLPYGEDTVAAGPDPVRFGGKELDAETQQYYFGARHCRHTAGRFGTVDPILDAEGALFDPQQFNRYACAWNNPLRYVDPLGLYGCETSETHGMVDGLYTVVYNVSCGPDDGDRRFEERSWFNWLQNGQEVTSGGIPSTPPDRIPVDPFYPRPSRWQTRQSPGRRPLHYPEGPSKPGMRGSKPSINFDPEEWYWTLDDGASNRTHYDVWGRRVPPGEWAYPNRWFLYLDHLVAPLLIIVNPCGSSGMADICGLDQGGKRGG